MNYGSPLIITAIIKIQPKLYRFASFQRCFYCYPSLRGSYNFSIFNLCTSFSWTLPYYCQLNIFCHILTRYRIYHNVWFYSFSHWNTMIILRFIPNQLWDSIVRRAFYFQSIRCTYSLIPRRPAISNCYDCSALLFCSNYATSRLYPGYFRITGCKIIPVTSEICIRRIWIRK